jgi:hypothetical protein
MAEVRDANDLYDESSMIDESSADGWGNKFE